MRGRDFLKMATVCGGAVAIPRWRLPGASRTAADGTTESAPIVFNQLGYLPDAAKLITLRAPSTKFLLRAVSGGAVVLQDKPGAVREDSASGDRVQICDISPVRQPGMYVLETDA